jgi:hypothetical protein
VFVACGDVNGDGVADIVTGAGTTGLPHVRAFSVAGGGVAEVASFYAYSTAFTGGVRVAVGDVNGDGVADIITGAGLSGGPHVRAFSLASGAPVEIASFYAYDPVFAGGIYVAAGDLDGDGVAEIVTGTLAPAGEVRVFKVGPWGVAGMTSVVPYTSAFRGEVRVAVADLDADGLEEIITSPGAGGGPHVMAFSFRTGTAIPVASFYAYDPRFCDVDPADAVCDGVFVAAANVVGDERAEILTGTNREGGPVRVFGLESGVPTIRMEFFPYFPAFRGPVHLASRHVVSGGRILAALAPNGDSTGQMFASAPPIGRLMSRRSRIPASRRGSVTANLRICSAGRRSSVPHERHRGAPPGATTPQPATRYFTGRFARSRRSGETS